MDRNILLESSEKGKLVGERKCYPNSVKDVKKKLSFINKKICDLHNQRKFVYKNSVKVKKTIHNQVNQVIKCLQARERNLWCQVDEAYLLQDANISDQLSRLQSIHAQCQALCNHVEELREKSDILRTINSILSQASFGEKADAKPLEFLSDFEIMKSKADNFGYLGSYCTEKIEGKNDNQSNINCVELYTKTESVDQTSLSSNTVFSEKDSYFKETDCEDFQVIDLLDNMCCHDSEEDFVMAGDENLNFTSQAEKQFNRPSTSRNEKLLTKVYDSSNCSYETQGTYKDFIADDEWKKVLEMNKKIASFHEMTSKLSEKKQIHHKIKSVDNFKSSEKLCDINCRQNSFLLLKEADIWLHNLGKKNDILESKKTVEKLNIEKNISPAESIQKSFKPYLAVDNVNDWLASH